MTGKQWLTLLGLALIWGSSFLFIKWGVTEMPVLTVVVGRLAMGLLFLIGALLVTGQRFPRRALWKPLLVVALVNNALPWFFLTWGEQHVASGLAAVLNATTPFFSVLLASTWGDESFTWSKGAGLLLGFVGVVVLIGEDVQGFLKANNLMLWGEIAIIGAALCYAIGAVYARRALRGESALQLATGQLTFALLMVLPFALLPANLPTAMPSNRALLGVAALGLFGSGLAYMIFYGLLEQVGATRTVIVTYLLPIVALFLGWLLLDEAIARETVLGLGLILGGVGLVNGMQPRWRRPPILAGAPKP